MTVFNDSRDADSDDKRIRQTSSIGFPYLDLEDALEVAKAIFTNTGRECTLDQLAAYTGHDTVNSGAFRQKLATARIFGVISVTREKVQLTTLGLEAVEPDCEKSARVTAFLTVPLYKAVFERFRGRQLPPDGALERTFAELGVAIKQTGKARQAFQRSAEQAGFFAAGRDRLIEPALRNGRRDTVPVSAPVLTPDVKQSAASDVPALPELVTAMFKQLPPDGTSFPKDRRARWLATLENVLELVYGSDVY